MRADRLLALGATLALAACLAPMDPSRVPVAAVRVTLGSRGTSVDTLQVRGTVQVRAAAVADAGYDIGRTDFNYTSADPAVAVVDSLGTVRGVSVGTTTITASLPDGKHGAATVVVVPSTVAYRIPVGGVPGAIAFSPDYSKAYVAVGSDSVAIVDAFGFYRIQTVDVGQRVHGIASTGTAVYATNPDVDSVSVISPATKSLVGRIWVGAGPEGIAAFGGRAYVAARYDRKIVTLDDGSVTVGLPVGGEPHDVALSGTGTRLFATVDRGGAWYVVSIDPAAPDTLASFALPGRPAALAVSRDGDAVYVVVPGAGLLQLAVGGTGAMTLARTVAVPANAAGVAVRSFGIPYVVVSGSPLTIFDGASLGAPEHVSDGGDEAAALRPDGLFVFVGDRSTGELHVIGL